MINLVKGSVGFDPIVDPCYNDQILSFFLKKGFIVRHKLCLLFVVSLVLLVGCESKKSTEKDIEVLNFQIGKQITIGRLDFQISKISQIEQDDFVRYTVSLDAKNNSKKGVAIFTNEMVLVDQSGQAYHGRPSSIQSQLNTKFFPPHDKVKGNLVYEVPKQKKIVKFRYTPPFLDNQTFEAKL